MRLRTLPVSIAGVITGCGCAAFMHGFRLIPALICLMFAIMAQVVSNFANEYFDFKNGLDKKGRDGFRRGVTEGDITPDAMRKATFGLLAATCLLGLTLTLYGGVWLIAIGILIGIFALAYSTGPYPLSHHGLGDIAVVVFFGIIPVCFTCYVQTGYWSWQSPTFLLSIATGLMAANVLVVNNYRDADDDRQVGKHTSIVILGKKFGLALYLADGIAAAAITTYALHDAVGSGWIAAVAAYIAIHLFLWRQLCVRKGTALNPLLGATAMLLLASSAALAAALA